jgi:ATP-dependent protease ClpP protease subunit
VEIELYGDIVSGSAAYVRTQLPDSGPVTVRINSDGGSVREGLAIFNALKEHDGEITTVVDGGAFSIAAYIAMAGDVREIAENGMLMIHGAHAETTGNASEHKQSVEMLETANQSMMKAFTDATGKTEDDIRALLAVDTWMDAEQALAEGFVTTIGKRSTLAASIDPHKFNSMPQRLVAQLGKSEKEAAVAEKTEKVPATLAQLKAIYSNAEWLVAMQEKEVTQTEAVAEYAKAMEEAKADSDAKLAAMEEEMESLRSRLKAMEGEMEEAKAMDEEEEAKARGVEPVANAGTSHPSASCLWKQAVKEELAKGYAQAKAVQMANKRNPGLRQRMLDEANA